MLIKTLIFITLAAMIASLFRGMFFLSKEKKDPKGLVKALTVRVSLAAILVVLIIIGIKTGAIQPHGLS